MKSDRQPEFTQVHELPYAQKILILVSSHCLVTALLENIDLKYT